MIPLFEDVISDDKYIVPEATMEEDKETVSYEIDSVTSYEYELTYAGFKEDIVVNEYTGQTEYSFILKTDGLKIYEEYGSFFLTDHDGNIKATIGDIIIFTADEANNTMGTMTYETVKPFYEYKLTIHVDAEYLADKKTVYPIRIDPTIEVNYTNDGAGAIEDVTINSATTYSGTSGSLYVGRHSNGSISRILMRFPNMEMPVPFAPMILSAQVEMRDLMCQDDEDMYISCNEYSNSAITWSESGTTTWNSVGSSYRSTAQDSLLVSYGKGNVEKQRYGFDITELAKRWADGIASPQKGIVFSATGIENGTNKWYKTFASYNRSAYKPSLTIQYETKTVCLIRNTANGTKYLTAQGVNASSLTFRSGAVSDIVDNGKYLWCIEYLPESGNFNVVSLGQKCSNGTGTYALLNAGSSTGLVQRTSSNPYIRFKMVRYANGVYYFKSASAARYLASNGIYLCVSATKNSYSRMYVDRIDTASFNNFYSGTYSKGIYDGVAHIKIVKGSSFSSHALFKNYDLSAALLWNGITENVVIYGPNDTVPSGITPFYVTFETWDLGDGGYGYTAPNGYTYEQISALSDEKQMEINASNWSSATIYLNSSNSTSSLLGITDSAKLELMINKVIAHEMGHVLKLTHPGQTIGLHEFEGARGGYSTASQVTLYSIMHQGKTWFNANESNKIWLVSAVPQAFDMINLISKWEHHQNCSH